MADHNRGLIAGLFLGAIVLGFMTWISCAAWQRSSEETAHETAARADLNFQRSIDDLASGQKRGDIPPPGPAPWPARHAILSGLFAFVGILVVGRVFIFMRRLEDQQWLPDQSHVL